MPNLRILAVCFAVLASGALPATATARDDLWTSERMRAAEALAATSAPSPSKPVGIAKRKWWKFPARAFLAERDTLGARTVGRLYSVRPDGLPFVCSATLVESANASVVWTAGHCVHSGRGGEYHHDVAFAPATGPGAPPNGEAPYGLWPAVQVTTTASWAASGDREHFRRDFGAVVVGRNPSGQTIREVIGAAQRIDFSDRAPRRAELFGYPGLGRFTGNTALWHCPSRPMGRYRRVRGAGPPALVLRCEMNAGSSGGPWLVNANRDGIGTVAAVTSASSSHDRMCFAPVQETVAERLYRTAEQVPV